MNEENGHNIGGLVFVALMFIGAGIGLLFGRPDAGGAIGMGLGFLAMAYLRAKKHQSKVRENDNAEKLHRCRNPSTDRASLHIIRNSTPPKPQLPLLVCWRTSIHRNWASFSRSGITDNQKIAFI